MGINIRDKGANGEREVATALNLVVYKVLTDCGIAPLLKPVIQRNQNQTAVGGYDLTGPFGLGIEIKRQEALSVNTWWQQCITSCKANRDIPILIYRKNKMKWSVVMYMDVPVGCVGAHCAGIRAEMSWDDFLRWFYKHVECHVRNAKWIPHE